MRVCAFSLLLFVAAVVPAFAQPFANAKSSVAGYSTAETAPGKACESLASFKSADLLTLQARVVPAAGEVPQHCRVTGVIAPEVAFEVHLPERWNRRFYMTGNGGLAGDALDGPVNAERTAALANGFVTARTNTGHDSRKEPSGTFVLSNAQKAVDYAYRAVHVTAETAKKITADYYGRPIAFSYWNSCSNGGRQGLLEAQRYPDDFDGIVAGAPVFDYQRLNIAHVWMAQRVFADNLAGNLAFDKDGDGTPESLTKIEMVKHAVLEECDAADGIKDEVIDDPPS